VSLLPNFISKALLKRENEGNFRVLPDENQLIDFCSNDYLGLARNASLAKIIENEYANAIAIHKNGSTGSRLISGNFPQTEQLESYLASTFKSESALLFNSGYVANMGVLSTIPQKSDTILYDELSHACIKDGMRLSYAERFAFRHNDLKDVEKKLSHAKGDKYIVVESIYSMDGDEAPLEGLVAICKQFDAYLIVDEAHSTGIVGENGSGLVCKLGLEKEVFVRIHTFGKAMGCHGACVVAENKVKNFLINFSRPFIYTTAMPLHQIITIKSAFEYLHSHILLQGQLVKNINFFIAEIKRQGLENRMVKSESAIQALVFPGNMAVKQLAAQLEEKAMNVKPILSPTVKTGEERLRICLHSFDTHADIKLLVCELAAYACN